MLLPTTVVLCSITFIRGVTGASYNLESVAAVVSLQEFVPDTTADRKTSKYASLSQSYLFVPVAVETMGAINEAGMNLGDLGRRITKHTDDHRESAFL